MKKSRVFKNLILIVFCMFFLCGCATIEHFRFYDEESGTVTDIVSIVLDTNKISASTLDKLDNEIKADMEEYRKEASKVAGVVEVLIPETNKYAYAVETKFASIAAIDNLYGSDIGPFSQFLANKHRIWAEEYTPFFYKYQPDESNSILWSIKYQGMNNQTFYDKYYEIVTGETATASSFSTEYLTVSQTFMTNLKDLHSNADIVESDAKYTKFTWNLSDKPIDYQVELYGLRARTSAWYVVGIISASVLAVILIVIAVVRDVRKDKKVKVKESTEIKEEE